MNKSKKCADQALNLIKKKTNKLAFTDYPKIPRGQCKPVYVPKITKPCGTKIRYCTAKELKLMAGTRVCECTQDAFEMRKLIINSITNVLKAATIFGVAYVTYDLGFWGVSEDTEATFASICSAMACETEPCESYAFLPEKGECEQELELLKVPLRDPCSCENPIPVDMEKCCYKMKQLWNHSVIFFFEGIINAPDNIIAFMLRKWEELMKQEDCGVCRPITDETVIVTTTDTCELYDDYDEKYADVCDRECEGNIVFEDEDGGAPGGRACGT